MPIIIDKKISSRTPKCYLQQSWAHNPEDSKINLLVRACERQVDREPSLDVGVGHISWLMMGLLALTRQNQLLKSTQVKSPSKACLFQDCLSWRNVRYVHSTKIVSEGIASSEKWDREKQLAKMKFLFIGHLRTPSKACPQWTLWETGPKGWFCKLLEVQLGENSNKLKN